MPKSEKILVLTVRIRKRSLLATFLRTVGADSLAVRFDDGTEKIIRADQVEREEVRDAKA